jgi:hypothetical protein
MPAARFDVGRHINSFNASGISLPFIENLAVPQMLPGGLIRAFGVALNHRRAG